MSEKQIHIPIDEVTTQPETEEHPTETDYFPLSQYKEPKGERDKHHVYYEVWDGGSSITQKIFEDNKAYITTLLEAGMVSSLFEDSIRQSLAGIEAIEARVDDAGWNTQMTALIKKHEYQHRTQHIRFGSPKLEIKGEDVDGVRNRFLHDMYREAQAVMLDSATNPDISDEVMIDRLRLFGFEQQKDLGVIGADRERLIKVLENLDTMIIYHIRLGTHPFAYLTLASGRTDLFEQILDPNADKEELADGFIHAVNTLLAEPEMVLDNARNQDLQLEIDRKLMHYAQLV